jgi:four helix bundle protein
MGIVAEEADESVFWLEMLAETGIIREQRIEQLLKESRELTAIFTASFHSTKTTR